MKKGLTLALVASTSIGVPLEAAANFDGDCSDQLTVGRKASKYQRVATYGDNDDDYKVQGDWGDPWGSGHYTTGVAYGDINGDGIDELAVSRKSSSGSRVFVFWLQPNGDYEVAWEWGDNWGHNRFATDVAFGDIDGDGRDEMAFTRDAGSDYRYAVIQFSVSGSDVSGDFIHTDGHDWGSNAHGTSVAFGDPTGEGRDVLAVGRDADVYQRVQLVRFNSEGKGRQSWTIGEAWAADNEATDLAWGDVDGDGREELAYSRRASDHGRFYVRSFDFDGTDYTSTLRHSDGHDWGSSNYATAVDFGDIDGDGRAELAVGRKASKYQRVKIVWWKDADTPTDIWFKGDNWASENHATDVAFGDSNGDGYHELAIAREASKYGRWYIWEVTRNGDSAFDNLLHEWGSDWDDDNYATALAFKRSDWQQWIDSDGDGLPDYVESARSIDLDCNGTAEVSLPPVDPEHKDLLVEVDIMSGEPNLTASYMQSIKDAFSRAPVDAGGTANPDEEEGISIWFDTPGSTDFPVGSRGGGTIRASSLSRAYDGRLANIRTANFDPNRERYFRYAIISRSGPDDPGNQEGGAGSCNDGVDNDMDGLADRRDPECNIDNFLEERTGLLDPNGNPLTAGPGSCSDGIDNNVSGDGGDGADNECASIPFEIAGDIASCFDFDDNQADGANCADTDCLDPTTMLCDPTRNEDGAGPNSCGDLNAGVPFDNGANGADLADPACTGLPQEGAGGPCWDGIDNNGDGTIDLNDPACAGFPTEDGGAVNSSWDGIDNGSDGFDGTDDSCTYRSGWANRQLRSFFAAAHDPGTFMHELGHTLGLGHGGAIDPDWCPPGTQGAGCRTACVSDAACTPGLTCVSGECFPDPNVNCKPNYTSVMSYAYQVGGIPTALLAGAAEGGSLAANTCSDGLDNDGDRMIDVADPDCRAPGQDVTGNGSVDAAFLDYSPPRTPTGTRNVIFPSLLDESGVLEQTTLNPTQTDTLITYSDSSGNQRWVRGDGWDMFASETLLTSAPGTCSNGIDDDGNSLIDQADGTCTGLDLDANSMIEIGFGNGAPVDLRAAVNDACGNDGPLVLHPSDDWSFIRMATFGPNAPGIRDTEEEIPLHLVERPKATDLSLRFLTRALSGAVGAATAATVRVENRGPSDVFGASVRFHLPSGIVWTDANPRCEQQGTYVDCGLGLMRAGGASDFSLELEIGPNSSGQPRVLIASARHELHDEAPDNNTDIISLFSVPRLASFDHLDDWAVPGGAELSTNATQGTSSLRPLGCGYMAIKSTDFNTAEWEIMGDNVAFDIFIPDGFPEGAWVGDVQLHLRSLNSGVYDQYLGYRGLTKLPRGVWSPLSFQLTPEALSLLDGDNPSAELEIDLNLGSSVCDGTVLLDNLRLEGNERVRSVFHQSQAGSGLGSADFMSFDTMGDWYGLGSLETVTEPVSQGTGALRVDSASWTRFVSRDFSTGELSNVTSMLSVDIMVSSPPENPYWLGDMQMYFDCPNAGVYNAHLGWRTLGQVFFDEFNAVEFELPPYVLAALQGDHDQCRFEIHLGGNPMPEGFVLDNMGFVQ